MKIFQLKKTEDVSLMPMQKQYGFTDYDVFAIALMTSLAHKEDPTRFEYKQMEFR